MLSEDMQRVQVRCFRWMAAGQGWCKFRDKTYAVKERLTSQICKRADERPLWDRRTSYTVRRYLELAGRTLRLWILWAAICRPAASPRAAGTSAVKAGFCKLNSMLLDGQWQSHKCADCAGWVADKARKSSPGETDQECCQKTCRIHSCGAAPRPVK